MFLNSSWFLDQKPSSSHFLKKFSESMTTGTVISLADLIPEHPEMYAGLLGHLYRPPIARFLQSAHPFFHRSACVAHYFIRQRILENRQSELHLTFEVIAGGLQRRRDSQRIQMLNKSILPSTIKVNVA